MTQEVQPKSSVESANRGDGNDNEDKCAGTTPLPSPLIFDVD